MANKATMIDYGPLASLIGTWQGDKGIDIAPEIDGQESNLYREKMIFEPIKNVSNAEEQDLVVLFYHQVVTRISDDKLIHHESGYYSWDQKSQIVMKSFSIPRGVAVNAGGVVVESPDCVKLTLQAGLEQSEWGITQSPFMQQKASTKYYQFELSVFNNELSYSQTMSLDIFDKSFEHTDNNVLLKMT